MKEKDRYYEEFSYSEGSYSYKLGEPHETASALGFVIMTFSRLGENLSNKITLLLHLPQKHAGEILSSELAFRSKINLFYSLVDSAMPESSFNTGRIDPVDMLKDLIRVLVKCNDLRNMIMHSTWIYHPYEDSGASREKITARVNKGLRIDTEYLTAGQLVDISDYMIYANEELDNFFIRYPDGN